MDTLDREDIKTAALSKRKTVQVSIQKKITLRSSKFDDRSDAITPTDEKVDESSFMNHSTKKMPNADAKNVMALKYMDADPVTDREKQQLTTLLLKGVNLTLSNPAQK